MDQVKKNFIFNALTLFINLSVGVIYTPYLIKHLGIVAYGLLPMSLAISHYIGVVTGSLTSALTRYYTVAEQSGNSEEANKFLNVTLIVIIAIMILLIIPIYFLISNLDELFNISDILIKSAKLLLTFTVVSFFLSLFSIVFSIPLYSLNRLDLLNTVKILRVGGKFLLLMIIFYVSNEKDVSQVGIAALVAEVLVLGLSTFFFFTHSKYKFNFKGIFSDFGPYKLIFIASLWTIVHQFGDMGLYRSDVLIVSSFWTSKESGILGAFEELGGYFLVATSVLSTLSGPLILVAFANGNHFDIKRLSIDQSLIIGVLLASIVGVVSGFSSDILNIWLGNEYTTHSNWLVLKLALIPFFGASGIFAFVFRSWNVLRFPAIMSVFFGLCNVSLAFFISFFSSRTLIGIQWILALGLIMGIIQSYIFSGFYLSRLYPEIKVDIIKNFIKISVVYMSTLIFCKAISFSLPELTTLLFLSLLVPVIFLLSFFSLKITLNENQYASLIELVSFKFNVNKYTK